MYLVIASCHDDFRSSDDVPIFLAKTHAEAFERASAVQLDSRIQTIWFERYMSGYVVHVGIMQFDDDGEPASWELVKTVNCELAERLADGKAVGT